MDANQKPSAPSLLHLGTLGDTFAIPKLGTSNLCQTMSVPIDQQSFWAAGKPCGSRNFGHLSSAYSCKNFFVPQQSVVAHLATKKRDQALNDAPP